MIIEPGFSNHENRQGVIYYVDCLYGMDDIDSNVSFDFFFADPDFGLGNIKSVYNRTDDAVQGYKNIDPDSHAAFTRSWVRIATKRLKPHGAGVICSGWSNLKDILAAIDYANLTVVNHVIWKFNFGVYTKNKFVSSHYHLLFVSKHRKKWTFNTECRFPNKRTLCKGKRGTENLNYKDREDVWTINREYHPGVETNENELPMALLEKVLAYTTRPGDLVLDPFMGSGTTAAACIKMGRKFVGFEINEKAADRQVTKMKEAFGDRPYEMSVAHVIEDATLGSEATEKAPCSVIVSSGGGIFGPMSGGEGP